MSGVSGPVFDERWPIIIVLGQTGCGKSTFIEKAGPKLATKPQIGHGLQSHTRHPDAYKVESPHQQNQYAILIDTPGFNDSDAPTGDKEQLDTITSWLKGRYEHPNTILLQGIVYLYDIKDSRIQNSPTTVKPRQLPPPPGVTFITTKWCVHASETECRQYEDRESELIEKHLSKKAHPTRFYGTTESAWGIIDVLCTSPSSMTIESFINVLDKISADLATPPKTGFAKNMYSRIFSAFHRR